MKLIITPKDIQLLMDKSYSQSYRMYCVVKDTLGKKKFQPLLVSEFCKYYDIPYQEALNKMTTTIKKNNRTHDK